MTEESHGGCKPQMTSYPNGLTEGGGMQEGCGMGRGKRKGLWGGGGGGERFYSVRSQMKGKRTNAKVPLVDTIAVCRVR